MQPISKRWRLDILTQDVFFLLPFFFFLFYGRCLEKELFLHRSWKLGGSCCLRVEAGFGPCGAEPSCGYVTQTSHPDVQLEVYAGAAQRRARSLRIVSTSLEVFVSAKSASALAVEPENCPSSVKVTEQPPSNSTRSETCRLMFNSEQHLVNSDMDS